MGIFAVNPASDETIMTYSETTPEEVARVLEEVQEAFNAWRAISFADRGARMRKAAGILRRNVNDYAALMAIEMGKPVRDGRAEIEKCAWTCEYFAENTAGFLKPESIPSDASRSMVTFHPLGIVLAVMPWNYPFWQVFRFAAPTLMAGNAALLKHASNVPGCALAIEAIFQEAGFPESLFRTVLIGSTRVDALIEHPLVRAVTLTGSRSSGRTVGEKAGAALKKSVLELGGSDPFIVLDDADLEAAARTAVASRLLNSGQSCIAAKRFIVTEKAHDGFVELMLAGMRAARVGDPLAEETTVGPQAKKGLRDLLHRQVEQTVARGAACLLGGKAPAGKGAFYPPTVLVNVRKGMPAFDEETFGPVAAITRVKNEDEAVLTANDTVYGLGATIFTRNIQRGERIAARIEAGNCFINALVKSDPRLPFGGVKDSGYGRELSAYGLREFVNIKTTYIA